MVKQNKPKISNACLWHKLSKRNNPVLTSLDAKLDKPKIDLPTMPFVLEMIKPA